MENFIEFIAPIEFIGDTGGGPPPGQVGWDENTPWDNNTFWT